MQKDLEVKVADEATIQETPQNVQIPDNNISTNQEVQNQSDDISTQTIIENLNNETSPQIDETQWHSIPDDMDVKISQGSNRANELTVEDLNKNDYSLEKNNGVYNFMGYLPFFDIYKENGNDFYPEGEMSEDYIPSDSLMGDFENIYNLCKENGIELVVITLPTSTICPDVVSFSNRPVTEGAEIIGFLL